MPSGSARVKNPCYSSKLHTLSEWQIAPSQHIFIVLDFIQIRQRPLQLALQMPHTKQALDARQQLEFVDRLADEIIRAAFAGLLDVTQLVQCGDHQYLDVAG